MGWSGALAGSLRHPSTDTNTNHNDGVRGSEKRTGLATRSAVLATEEIFPGIDTAKAHHVVARFVLGEGVEGMTTATLLARVARWRKAGARVHGVDKAGPTGFALAQGPAGRAHRRTGRTSARPSPSPTISHFLCEQRTGCRHREE